MPAPKKTKPRSKPAAASSKTAKPKSKAKKPAAAKPPRAAPRAADAAAIDDDLQGDVDLADAAPTHSWEDLLRAHGPATDDDRAMYEVNVPVEELVEIGNRVASSRVLTDLLRFSGQIHDYLERTGGEHKVLGFSEARFRVVLEDGNALADSYARSASDAKASGGATKRDTIELDRRSRALRLRFDSLYAAVDHATRDQAVSSDVVECWTRALDPATLAASAEALAKVAKGELGRKRSLVARRLADGGVDAALVTALDKEAKDVAAAAKRVNGPRVGPRVTQRQLDFQDGVCVTHMQAMLDLFGAARAADPSVPNLIPIATRTLFGHKPAGHAAAPQPAQSEKPADAVATEPQS